MSTLNIDEATRKSKFADYKDGDTVEIEFSGTLNGLTVAVDDATLECCESEMEEEEPEKTKPPAAVTAAVSKKSKPSKKFPPGMEGTMGEEAE